MSGGGRKKKPWRVNRVLPGVENEYELQKTYHEFIEEKYPYSVTCGTPYANMSIKTRQMALKKGYLTSYPDYVEHDPAAEVTFVKDSNNQLKELRLKIIPGRVIEFKTPKGTGSMRKEQDKVLKALDRRGYEVLKTNDLVEAMMTRRRHKRERIPLYRGEIVINTQTFKIEFPKPPFARVKLPGRDGVKKPAKVRRRRRRTGRSSARTKRSTRKRKAKAPKKKAKKRTKKRAKK